MKRTLTALAALLVCTACAPVSSTTPAEPAPSTSAATPATLSAGGKPQAPGGTAPATLGIAWDEASKTAALETATKAMTLYARPTVTDKVWIQELGQVLTAQATADYQYVDPANIPVTKVTGTGQLKSMRTTASAAMSCSPPTPATTTCSCSAAQPTSPGRSTVSHPRTAQSKDR
jgi:hypothetical protein